MQRTCVLSMIGFILGLLAPSFVLAQTCPTCIQPGNPVCPLNYEGNDPVRMTVTGCYASVLSNWDDGWKTESCNASAPQGTALLNVLQTELSGNNGNYTVSRFTTGSMKYSEQVDEAYKSMYEAAVEYGDTTYAAEIKREWDRHRAIAQQWEGTSDAARLTVSAKGSGNFWDQWRGWQTVKVDLQVICIAPANLREQLEKKLGFNQFAAKSSEYIAIENNTPSTVYGLAQPLPDTGTTCADAKGESSGMQIEKSLQKNIRINSEVGTTKNKAMCIVFGKTRTPGYADFSKACVVKSANLTQVGALPPECFVN